MVSRFSIEKDFPVSGNIELDMILQKRVVYEPISIAERKVIPRIKTRNWLFKKLKMPDLKNYTMNFGPQHPAQRFTFDSRVDE